jgi:uncharacterized protein YehS (DUF1456 family)
LTNNDILRQIRYTFDFKDATMVDIFASAEATVTNDQVANWLRKEGDEFFQAMKDSELATFLNGFINN